MEGTAHLLQLVRKMRSQITQLERENRALRGELEACGQKAELPRSRADGQDSTMTVRRYSTASPAPAPSSVRSHRAGKRPPSSGVLDVPGSAQPPTSPPASQLACGEEKGLEKSPASSQSYSHSSKVKLFREHVRKCRAKVKAVSFLLPAGMPSYAEKQGSLKSPQNQSPKQLPTIAEKDT